MDSIKQTKSQHLMLMCILIVVVCVFLSGCGVKKPKVVGILSGSEPFANIADGFKAKMTELGYVEGKNIIYDIQRVNFDPVAEGRILKKFVQDKVDLIFAFPTETAVAAKAATQGTKIPVVFAMAGIETSGLVESVRHPGGNITGVRFPLPEIFAKQIEFLHELVPNAKRVYSIYTPGYPNTAPALSGMRSTISSLGLTLVEEPVRNIEELKAVLEKRAALDDIGIDAIVTMPDILNNSPDGFELIFKFANEHNLPMSGGMDISTNLGALFNYVPENTYQGRLAASLADKIFRGIPAGTIPVVTPEARLRLNYKVIQKLGLNVSESLLSRADEVIR